MLGWKKSFVGVSGRQEPEVGPLVRDSSDSVDSVVFSVNTLGLLNTVWPIIGV